MQNVISTLKWSSIVYWQRYYYKLLHIWQSIAAKYLKTTDGDNARNIVVSDQTELWHTEIALLI